MLGPLQSMLLSDILGYLYNQGCRAYAADTAKLLSKPMIHIVL